MVYVQSCKDSADLCMDLNGTGWVFDEDLYLSDDIM